MTKKLKKPVNNDGAVVDYDDMPKLVKEVGILQSTEEITAITFIHTLGHNSNNPPVYQLFYREKSLKNLPKT